MLSHVLVHMVGIAILAVLFALAEHTQRSVRASVDGWKTLRPSWLQNLWIALSVVLALVPAYMLLTGGSALPDAETQNLGALLISVASSASTVYLTWLYYGRTVMWRGDELRVRTGLRRPAVYRLSALASVSKSEWEHTLLFGDGAKLVISNHMHGLKQLIASLPARVRGGG